MPTTAHAGWAYGLAIMVWVVYNAVGIAKHGFGGYLKLATLPAGVPVFMWWLIIPLEFFSNIIVRPITLALRLFANMFAGHLLVLVFVLGGEYLLLESEGIVNNIAGGVSLVFSMAIFAPRGLRPVPAGLHLHRADRGLPVLLAGRGTLTSPTDHQFVHPRFG